MNAIRPGAEAEYSRGPGASQDGRTARRRPPTTLSRTPRIAVVAAGLVGAALLIAAEFSPLLTISTSARGATVSTVSTLSHNSGALFPLALLALLMAIAIWRTGSRMTLLALGMVGVVAILIALLGDLPDAQATGLIGSASTRYAVAASSPAAGLYLETLGAAVLIIAGGAGLLLNSAPRRSVGAS